MKGDPVEPFSLPSLSKSQLPVFVKFTQTHFYVSSINMNMHIRPVHKKLFMEFPKYQGRFMLHFDI